MSLYKRDDRKFYLGAKVATLSEALHLIKEGRWFYLMDKGNRESSRPIHGAWIANRGFQFIGRCLERGYLHVAEENENYRAVPSHDTFSLHALLVALKSENGELWSPTYIQGMLDDLEERYPFYFGKKDPKPLALLEDKSDE